VAYSFARLRWPGRDLCFGLLVATMLLPPAITLVPRYLLFEQLGWLDSLLPLTVPYWFATTAIYVFLLRQYFRGLPFELEEAARIEGASQIRILFQIILPLSRPAIAAVAVLALVQHYNDYLNPLIYVNNPKHWTLAVSLGALSVSQAHGGRWALIAAASTIMIAPVLFLFAVAHRSLVNGSALTDWKG
jgi:ABC-type glycerol-3-phosphate transport system permease component